MYVVCAGHIIFVAVHKEAKRKKNSEILVLYDAHLAVVLHTRYF